MANRYFFDKRDMKRGGFKYLIIFLIAFVPAILFNIFVGKYIEQRWLIILIDCVLILAIVAIGNHVAYRIFNKKDRILEAKIKAREEMEERKRQILEESYNLKRLEKQRQKQEKLKEEKQDVVVIEEKDIEKLEKSQIKKNNTNTEKRKTTTTKKNNTRRK